MRTGYRSMPGTEILLQIIRKENMIIIGKILGNIREFDTAGLTVDKVLLDHYAMAKPHQKLKTESGHVMAVSLEGSERLYDGAVIYKDQQKVVFTELLPEDVLEIRPQGNLQWGKAAFNMGNMHHPAYLHDDCIVVPYDAIIENLLQGIGVEYIRCKRKLDGMRAGHVIAGHSHGHHHHHE